MISSNSPNGLGLSTAGDEEAAREKARVSVRFRRGPVVAIILAALLWAGLVAAWRLL